MTVMASLSYRRNASVAVSSDLSVGSFSSAIDFFVKKQAFRSCSSINAISFLLKLSNNWYWIIVPELLIMCIPDFCLIMSFLVKFR